MAAVRERTTRRTFAELLIGCEEDGTLRLEGVLLTPDGKGFIRAEIEGDVSEAEELGLDLARDVLEQGGREILAQIR